MKWEHVNGEYWLGKSGKARFQIGQWINTWGTRWGATLSYPGDSYGILQSAATVEEAKEFCEFVARAMGFEK